MAKKIIQDIVINSAKGNPPRADADAARRTKASNWLKKKPLPPKPKIVNEADKPRRGKRFLPKLIFWILSLSLFIFLIGSAINYFASVSIKIIPRQEFIEIDTDFKARRLAKGDALPFETMQLDYERGQTVKATGIEKINEKAGGQVVIYNVYSSKPQLLVENTRFETPDGKIYRIKKGVTVPGAEIKDGKIVYSSVEADVYADEPGEEYNIGLTDFTIPGFKGSPRYTKFYARSKTEMAGGFRGAVSVITDEDITNVRNGLKNTIENYLTETAVKQKPEEFLLYGDALTVDYFEPENNPKPGDRAENFEYKLKGTAVGFLLKKTGLTAELAKKYLGDNANEVNIANVGDIKFTLLKRDKENSEIIFNLNGRAHFVWDVDANLLLEDLKIIKRSEYDSVFAKYPVIENAEIIFKPRWWPLFPESQSRVHFEQILKQE